MTSKNVKVLVLGSVITLLAAGCNSSQPQASSQNSAPAQTANQTPTTPSSSSTMGNMPGMNNNGSASTTRGGLGMRNIPAGSKPFFGTITSISGSQVTISGRNSSSTVSTIINITGSTQFTGGTQSSLASGTRIAGIGTSNTDGSLNATSLQINPTFQGRGQGGHYQGGGQGAPNQQQAPQ